MPANELISQHLSDIMRPSEELYSIKPPLPGKLQLELNETCNHSCVFCPFHSRYLKEKVEYGVMAQDIAKKVLDEAYRLGIGKKELALFATGEPFLYKDLHKIVSHAKMLGFPYVYITTNGSLASSDKVESILAAGIDSIRVSLNAGTRQSYKCIHGEDDFNTVVGNIKTIKQCIDNSGRDVNFSVSFVRTKYTKNDAVEIERLIGSYVDEILYFDAFRLKDISEEVKDVYEIEDSNHNLKRKGNSICAPIFNTMYMDSKLNVNLCCNSLKTKLPMAKVDENIDLEKAWYSESFTRWRKRMLDGDEISICRDCFMRVNKRRQLP